jgi:hypothetical protein
MAKAMPFVIDRSVQGLETLLLSAFDRMNPPQKHSQATRQITSSSYSFGNHTTNM